MNNYYSDVHDGYKSVGHAIAPPAWQSSLVNPKPCFALETTPQQFHYQRQSQAQSFPVANLSQMTNFAFLQSDPEEALEQCAEHLRERNMTNFTTMPGSITGYFFQNNSNVKFNLRVKTRGEESYVLHAMRMSGDAFVFNNFWRALVADLVEKLMVEEEDEEVDSDASWAMDILFTDDEDDMDLDLNLNQDQYLKLKNDTDTVKVMIDDMKDPSFREACASTLAYNCANQDNLIVVMAFGQELFDTLIACIFCSMATCYYSQLPFYRSAAMLLDTMFENKAVQMVSNEQYDALVAATKSWAVASQNNQGEITNSEEIATILSKQLVRCAPRSLSEKALEELQHIQQFTTFSGVRTHVGTALGLVV